ncbi:MAG: hypothetical protein ACI819_001844 [Neolewinella sp.]|jgi:hypothetical protein
MTSPTLLFHTFSRTCGRALIFLSFILIVLGVSSCNKWLSKGQTNLELIWADEFKGEEPPNENKWTYDLGVGNSGWGNNEKQYYTDLARNVRLVSGKLIIEAHEETLGDARQAKLGSWSPHRHTSQASERPWYLARHLDARG